jgi:hypothetical protein
VNTTSTVVEPLYPTHANANVKDLETRMQMTNMEMCLHALRECAVRMRAKPTQPGAIA